MKILFLANIPSPYRVLFFNELGKYCDLTVVYELNNAINRNEKWKGKKAINYKEVFLNSKRINLDSGISFSILKFLKDKSFDLIIVGGYSTPTGMLAIKYLNLKKRDFILNCDGGMIKNDKKLKFLIKKYFISSAKYWLSSGGVSDKYLLHYGANKEGILRYHFTSLSNNNILKELPSRYEKIDIRKKLDIKEEKVILSVGRLIHGKGFDVLIKATKDIDDNIGIYIVGGKPTEEYIELIEKLNIKNIKFIDFKTEKELEKYYLASDLFILPTRGDVWGLVINEAMAKGIPFITTDKCVAGLEFVSKGNCGKIIKVDDVNSLSNSINEIINDDMLLNEMSKEALNTIKDYSIEKMAIKHIEEFKKILLQERVY